MNNAAILRVAYALNLAGVPVVYVARPDDPSIRRWTNPRVSKRTVLDILFRESKRTASRPVSSSHARAFSHRER